MADPFNTGVRPHVVHVVYWLRVAGLENGVVNLINNMNTSFRHTVLCVADIGPLAARLPRDVRVINLSDLFGEKRLQIWRLSRLLRELKPAIVHSRNWSTIEAVIAAWLAQVPVRIHGEHGRTASDPRGQVRSHKVFRRLISPLVDRFVTVSDDLRAWMVQDVRVPAEKVLRIHNGVDIERFAGGGSEAGRQALGFMPEDVIVGAVGRCDPVKDYVTLLEGFARLEKRPNWHLVIIGEGASRPELEARVANHDLGGRVHFLGERSNVNELIRGIDIFVNSSIAEGISNTILEAMATGLPVIATRTGGNVELVEDGVTGTLVQVGGIDELARVLRRYFDDRQLRLQHGKAGRSRAERHFSLGSMGRQYGDLYQSLLTQSRARLSPAPQHKASSLS